MAFPAVHWGNFGDEKVTSSTKINGFPLGIEMALPDGRRYIHTRAGGTAIVKGNLYQSNTALYSVADTMGAKSLVAASSYAVGATTVAFTTGGTTAIATDQFADGWVICAQSTGSDAGDMYKIKSNSVAGSGSATCTLTLYETDALVTAWASGTTRLGVLENKHRNVEVSVASTVNWNFLGFACSSAAASSYFWLSKAGEAPGRIGGTILVQQAPVVASSGIAGVIAKIAVAATTALLGEREGFTSVGVGLTLAAANGYGVVNTKL